MQYTPNYNLRMPEDGELYNVHDFNINEEIIDTALKNISDAENETSADLRLHVNDTSNPHSVTKEQILLGNVENKSSETIRNEITAENVERALGYTPLNRDKRNVIEGYMDTSDSDDTRWKFYFEYDPDEETYYDEVPIYADRLYVDKRNGKTYYRYYGVNYERFREICLSEADRLNIEKGNQAYTVRAKSIGFCNYIQGTTEKYSSLEEYELSDFSYTYPWQGSLEKGDTNKLIVVGKNITISNTEGNGYKFDLPDISPNATLHNALKFEVTAENITNALGYTPVNKGLASDQMTGATASTAGSRGLVPPPSAGDQDKALFGDGTWRTVSGGGGGGGTDDYTDLSNKPSINNVVLNGNKSLSDLGIVDTDATTSAHGLMSASDKAKLDSIDIHSGTIPSGGSEGQILGWLSSGHAKWVDYPLVSDEIDGLMLSEDKIKLDTVEENANYVVVKGDAEDEYRTGEVNITPANIGLGNVGNFKAVSTVGGQGLTETEQENARANIGAGTSDFSGDYFDLDNLPNLGTASEKDVTSTINGTNNVPTDKAVKNFVEGQGYITNTVNDLVNYYRKTQTYSKEEVNDLISAIPKFDIKVVEELPLEDISTTTIYLLLKDDPQSRDIYEEYIYVDGRWERLGAQKIDLDGVIYGDGVQNSIAIFTSSDYIQNGPVLGSDTTKFLRNDGTWAVPPGGGADIEYADLSDLDDVVTPLPPPVPSVAWDDILNKPNFGTASLSNTTATITGSINLPTDAAVKSYVEGLNYITNSVNDLTNYYLKTETYTKSEVNDLISRIPLFDIEVVNALPTEDISTTTVYLLISSDPKTRNIYDEYIYVDGVWEKLGSQTVDLSNYYTSSEVDTLLAGKASTSVATTSANGLMSSADKAKVDSTPTLVRVSGTLAAGATQLVLTNAAITTNSYVQVYTSVYGLVTENVQISNGSATLTYAAQESPVTVELWIQNFPS